MVRVQSIKTDATTMEAFVDLFSDTKDEVATTENSDIVGMLPNYSIGQGSSVMTASGEIAFRKSDGTWNWM